MEYKPVGPYILGGHSFGGIVAFEMAVQLSKIGHDIPLVILSDSILLKRIKLFSLKRGIKTRVAIAALWKLCNLFLKLKRKVPVKLRNFYILNNYNRMIHKYTVPDYNGKILLIKASQTDFGNKYMDWNRAAKNISVVEIDGEHNEIINNEELIKKFTKALIHGLKAVEPILQEA